MSIVRNSLAGIVTAVIVVAFGLFGGVLATRVGYLTVLSAVGAPYGLPGLRIMPLGETPWGLFLADVVAAVVLVVLVWRARRGFWGTWGVFVVAAVAANLLRAVAMSAALHSALGAYAGQLAGAVLAGLVWGLALGWIPALARAGINSSR
ncbi:hypothetical protein [Nonomuraea soli]|uniref:Uncharacterized protein n=1 Tax=Nonomuraea soli TaxID=1032476 RepID=A0A7W0CL32_9ACTN|nr:hypothetical protein [Nonomuraea soli]MBA2893133.1 hypothetical protein [Nonomuraea soli]